MKNRKSVVLPVSETVIAMLRELRAKAPPDRLRVFKNIPRIETFRRDLGRAEIQVLTPTGKLDFHCLRVTFATALCLANVPLVLAQRLMRHSDPKLTANIYTKLGLDESRAAVERIESLVRRAPKEGDIERVSSDGLPQAASPQVAIRLLPGVAKDRT
jgi:integrase